MMQLFHNEEKKKDYLLALYCLPALALIYTVGLWSGYIFAASVVAGGAMSVGFGANKKLVDYPLAPMVIAGVGMSCSAWLGSLAGNCLWLFMLLCISYSVLCALAGAIDQNAWWIVLQWSVAFFVAGYYPGDMAAALERGGLVLAGGVVQFVCIVFFLKRLFFHRNLLDVQQVLKILLHIHHDIDKKLHFNKVGVQAALAVGICMVTVHVLDVRTGYWSLMTTLLVLKPSFQNTFTRAKDRLLGTFVGILIADFLALAGIHPYLTVAEILLFSFLGYAFASRPYTILTTFITITAVLMFSVNGQPEFQVALDRIIATAIGGMASLVAMGMNAVLDYVLKFGWKKRTPKQ